MNSLEVVTDVEGSGFEQRFFLVTTIVFCYYHEERTGRRLKTGGLAVVM
jgi:hypothetical protein